MAFALVRCGRNREFQERRNREFRNVGIVNSRIVGIVNSRNIFPSVQSMQLFGFAHFVGIS
jgi:hypothetical protein